jgi:hypothetical protein
MLSDRKAVVMPDTSIAIDRIAQDAVRVQFVPAGDEGTAVFMIDLSREVGGTVDEADHGRVLLKAKAVAEHFIMCANREIQSQRT